MDKILAEYRKTLGDFEIVDIDEAKIADLRRQLDVDVPIDLHWTWNYGSEVEELRALYERGKRGQWNAESDIDWSAPFERSEWFLPKVGLQLMPSVLSIMGADDETCKQARSTSSPGPSRSSSMVSRRRSSSAASSPTPARRSTPSTTPPPRWPTRRGTSRSSPSSSSARSAPSIRSRAR
jgi:hypothetical protein